jgi:hypothetical protein
VQHDHGSMGYYRVMPRPYLCPLCTRVRGETVRNASEASMAWPYSPPRRHVFAHFALHIAAKSTLEALLVPLFGQFLHALG